MIHVKKRILASDDIKKNFSCIKAKLIEVRAADGEDEYKMTVLTY